MTGRKADTQSRHLRWEVFERRIHEGPPSFEPVRGTARAVVCVEPSGSRIGLRLFGGARSLPATRLAELTLKVIGRGKQAVVEVATTNPGLFRDFYQLGCVVADRVQIDGQGIDRALSETLKAWETLLRRKTLMPEEKQVGLVGELLFLVRLAKARSWSTAAQAWQGPEEEEHDFSLATSDVEVKTTRREGRIHSISSLTQLLPKPRRPLALLSIQVTAASDSKASFSLASLVASVLASCPQREADILRLQLEKHGWVDEDAPHYARPYQLRAPLLAVAVDRHFPAIVPSTLSQLSRENLARIEGLTYFVNVDGLGDLEDSKAYKKRLFG